eukprot:TRINITY_DN18020_c0_g1_i1.p1 TRINITY_DN18020_c0_g1~~TRINITY_DN18020_c0_g1_i1.p1  ORF type:complete len:408 (-),score=85.72 TRINITY_DN18020_c0_g1_i1:33-1211(-)
MAQPTLKLNQPKNVSQFDSLVPDAALLAQLKDMGFDVVHAQQALIATRNKDLATAMDWMFGHPFQPGKHVPIAEEISSHIQPKNTSKLPLLLTNDQKRKREEEKEKNRLDEAERKKAIINARLEKKREEEERNLILARVREAKQTREERRGVIKSVPVSTPPNTSFTASTSSNENTTLQIRLPEGTTVRQSFKSTDPLEQVWSWISSKINNKDFTLIIPFPRREFTDSDTNSSLAQLGLAPNGTLTVIEQEKRGVVSKGEEIKFVPGAQYGANPFLGGLGGYDVQDEDNPDGIYDDQPMEYEDWLALEEKIGNVDVGVSADMLNNIPVEMFKKADLKPEDDKICLICQMEIDEGEEIRKIPICGHYYHKTCIDVWLGKKKICPKCLQRVDGS